MRNITRITTYLNLSSMSKITIIPFSDRLFLSKCEMYSQNFTQWNMLICLCYNAGQSGGDFISLKHFKKRNRKMLKMLSFQPPKCSSGLLTKARRRNSLCGSIQLNGCTVQQVVWRGYRGRREREDGGQQCSSEFNFLPLLSIGERRASIYRQLDWFSVRWQISELWISKSVCTSV